MRDGRRPLSTNVLVDGNNLIHRIHHGFVRSREDDPLINKSGYPTGLIYGVLDTLAGWIRKIPNHGPVSLFLDGKPQARLDMDPEYKARERESMFSDSSIKLCDGFEASSEFDVLVHIFTLMGVDIYWHPTEEADDLIYSYVQDHPDETHIVVSTDKDFYQLVSSNVIQFRPKSGDNWFFDEERVYEAGFKEAKVRPREVRMYKALIGDSSDNIPGIPRLRKAVAAKLAVCMDPETMYSSNLAGFCSSRERSKIIELRNRIELNYSLVGFRKIDHLNNYKVLGDPDLELAETILSDDLDIHTIDLHAYTGKRVGRVITSDSLGFLENINDSN
jgi:5'-3' exonuclease